MLTCRDLLSQDEYPSLQDISLKLYCDFSRTILLKRRFHYYFEDETDAIVEFQEFGIRHLLGIHHIDGSISKEHFLDAIDAGLTLNSFSSSAGMNQRYKKMKPRIRFFSCTYNTLRCGRVFYFPDQNVPNTNDVKLDYIVYREISNKGYNVGIRYEKGCYVPLTILVDKSGHKQEHLNLNQTKVVKQLIISDTDTSSIIENIIYSDSFIMSEGIK